MQSLGEHDTMLFQCCTTVSDAGPTLKQYSFNRFTGQYLKFVVATLTLAGDDAPLVISRYKAFTHRWFEAGMTPQTSGQHQTNDGSFL